MQTANTLTFAVYMLIEYPDILVRLHEEILMCVGPNKRLDHEYEVS